jgi:hypothetical protein
VQLNVPAESTTIRRSSWEARIAVITVLTFGAALSAVLLFSLLAHTPRYQVSTTATTVPPGRGHAAYPVGVVDHHEPSGVAPPGPNAYKGYARTYANDFGGSALPAGWAVFTGVPGGDPAGQFGARHVVVHNGLLRLNAWRDPAYGMKWVTGGLCHCGHPQTYGAFFVRSRVTGAGPNESQLLWPANNSWPPEIDFNETGAKDTSTSWTVHWGVLDNIAQKTLATRVTQWHTWGVVWTPTKITFVVDGLEWGSLDVHDAVPHLPMTLDLQQRTGCAPGFSCPESAQSMLVDWVAEYQHV